MAPRALDLLSPEEARILNCIGIHQSFVLSGGAGSGKTYCLERTIRIFLDQYSDRSVACITFTNAAAEEVESRVQDARLSVSTIHDFLWNQISSFQLELRTCAVALANDPEEKHLDRRDGVPLPDDHFSSAGIDITYREYLRLDRGVISHDEVLDLAFRMFRDHPKLGRIVADRFAMILVDEYQDTSPKVVETLLDHMGSPKTAPIVGFFGDSMQAIYEGSIGSLSARLADGSGRLVDIQRTQNRRNPKSVIALANRLRSDGLVQVPSTDDAPNMNNGQIVEGEARFYYSSGGTTDKLYRLPDWALEEGRVERRELNLTHNLIATKAGFPRLMAIYDRDLVLEYRTRIRNYLKASGKDVEPYKEMTFKQVRDQLLSEATKKPESVLPTKGQQEYINANPTDYDIAMNATFGQILRMYVDKDNLLADRQSQQSTTERDELVEHLTGLYELLESYQAGDIRTFLKLSSVRITSSKDLRTLREGITRLLSDPAMTIGAAIDLGHTLGIRIVGDELEAFKRQKLYLYDKVGKVTLEEFRALLRYKSGKTPYSTQHKTKGREFDVVVVVLDNGNWNNYNFEYLFEGTGKESVVERTRKIFYVCCTRTKKKLAVCFDKPTAGVLERAKEWFGAENVIDLDS